MYIKNRLVSLIYKIITAAAALAGILLIGGFPSGFNLRLFKYYTVQSNVLCLVFIAAAAVHAAIQIKKSGMSGPATLLPRFKGAVTLAITVTLLVYQFMLADTPFSMTSGYAGNFLVHLLTPLLVILDWLLFDEKGRYNIFDPLRWGIIPFYYFIFALIAAQAGVTYLGGSRYPYFFLDADAIGAGGVALYVLGIAVAFFALSYIVFAFDRWLSRLGRPDKASPSRAPTLEQAETERNG
jgi:hypothetical protein